MDESEKLTVEKRKDHQKQKRRKRKRETDNNLESPDGNASDDDARPKHGGQEKGRVSKKVKRKRRVAKESKKTEDDGTKQSSRPSEDDVAELDASTLPGAAELEESIEKNAAKANLTTKNVKSILHHLFSDKKLLEFAKKAAMDTSTTEEAPPDQDDVEPRMTRSRWKQKKSEKNAASEFVLSDFFDDSEDEEYKPENESLVVPSDDESVSTTYSDQPSPQLLDATEPKQIKIENLDQFKPEIENDTSTDRKSFVTHEDGTVFRMPGAPVSETKVKTISENEEEIIARRTRSKVSMRELSLETLEASFEPPDYDPALYDSHTTEELDPDDLEWKNWLSKLVNNDEVDESMDENDDDFNFMAVEETLDDEEFRTDKGANISHKELQDLFNEVLNDFDEFMQDETSILSCVLPQLPMITLSQRLTITAQLQQHAQLLTQTYMLTCDDPLLTKENQSSKEYMKELVNFRNSMRNGSNIGENSIYCFPGLDDAIRIVDTFNQPSSFDFMIPQLEAMSKLREREKKPRKPDFIVPMPIKTGLRIFTEPYFATFPEILPKQGLMATETLLKLSREAQRLKFFRSEDSLLALGMSQFGNDFGLIAEYMLPVKIAKQLRTRAKNLCSKREYDNPVRKFKKDNVLPVLSSKVFITQPRTIPTKSIKLLYSELSYETRLPNWLEKIQRRVKLIEDELQKQANFTHSVVKFANRSNLRPLAVKDCPTTQIPVAIVSATNGIEMKSLLPGTATQPMQHVSTMHTFQQNTTTPTMQSIIAVQAMPPITTVQHMQQANTMQSVQSVSAMQSVQQNTTTPIMQSISAVQAMQPIATMQHMQQVTAMQSMPSVSAMQSVQYSTGLQPIEQGTMMQHMQQNTSIQPMQLNTTMQPMQQVTTMQQIPENTAMQTMPAVNTLPHLQAVTSMQPLQHNTTTPSTQQVTSLLPMQPATSVQPLQQDVQNVELLNNAADTIQQPSNTLKTEESSVENQEINLITSNQTNTSNGNTNKENLNRAIASPHEIKRETPSPATQLNSPSDQSTVTCGITFSLTQGYNGSGMTCEIDNAEAGLSPNTPDNVLDNENREVSDSGILSWQPPSDVPNDDLSDEQKTIPFLDDLSCDEDVEEQDEDSATEETGVPDTNSADVNDSPVEDEIAEHTNSPAEIVDYKEIEEIENEESKTKETRKSKNPTVRCNNNRQRKNKPRNPKFNWEDKLQEKASKFADLYFEKVKETLVDNNKLYCDFLHIVNDAGSPGNSKVQVYEKLASLFKDYPDLVEMFVGFLEPAEAREVGKFRTWLEFYRARTFLLNCEANFVKTKYYHQLLRKIVKIHETNHDSKTIVESFSPLFRGNQKLISEFTTFFPDLPPPKCRGEDFEIIEYRPEAGGFDYVDEFEEVKLSVDECDGEEPVQRRKTILDDLASWLQKPALNNTDGRSDKNEAKRTECPGSQKSEDSCWDSPTSQKSIEKCLFNDYEETGEFEKVTTFSSAIDREDSEQADDFIDNESNNEDIDRTEYDLSKNSTFDQSNIVDDADTRGSKSKGKFNDSARQKDLITDRTPNVTSSNRLPIDTDKSPSGTKLNKFRLNVKNFDQKDGFHRIIADTSSKDSNQHLGMTAISHVELFSGGDDLDDCENEAADDSCDDEEDDDDVSDESDPDDGDEKSLDALPARDLHYNDDGELIFKWSREDDRLILTTCQQKGPSDSTFALISDKIPGRTKSEVRDRFLKLIELYNKAAKSK